MNIHLDAAILNLYLDDALDAQARADADAHLQHCAACRAELERWRGVFSVFKTWRNEPIPRDVSVAVMARVRRRPAPRVRARWGILALAGQAALAVLLLAWALPRVLSVTGMPLPALDMPAFAWSDISLALAVDANMTLPLPSAAVWVWAVVITGSIVFWLVGNRLALSTLNGNPEASQ